MTTVYFYVSGAGHGFVTYPDPELEHKHIVAVSLSSTPAQRLNNPRYSTPALILLHVLLLIYLNVS